MSHGQFVCDELASHDVEKAETFDAGVSAGVMPESL